MDHRGLIGLAFQVGVVLDFKVSFYCLQWIHNGSIIISSVQNWNAYRSDLVLFYGPIQAGWEVWVESHARERCIFYLYRWRVIKPGRKRNIVKFLKVLKERCLLGPEKSGKVLFNGPKMAGNLFLKLLKSTVISWESESDPRRQLIDFGGKVAVAINVERRPISRNGNYFGAFILCVRAENVQNSV